MRYRFDQDYAHLLRAHVFSAFSATWFRNINRIPFRGPWHAPPFQTLRHRLGPTNPRPTTVLVEPFSASAERFLIFHSCYYHQDLHWWPLHACSRYTLSRDHHALLPTNVISCAGRPASVTRFSAIHFQGRSIRQVSCKTLLSGFLLLGPPPCCLYRPTPFVVSLDVCLAP